MAIRAERLDRLIDIERKTCTASPSGEPIESWEKIAAKVAASVSSVRGDERNTAPQWVALEQIEIWVRWSPVTASLTPLDRIVYPAQEEDSPAPAATYYDIMYVAEVGRMDGIKVTAARRADV